MFDDRIFFQIAAGLIPALMFGGLISGAFRPTRESGLKPLRERVLLLSAITIAVGIALLAEVFAIDLATTREYPSIFKVAFVVYGVVGSTALAGFALIRPWIVRLGGDHQHLVSALVVWAGGIVCLVAGGVLSGSITEAQTTLSAQRRACLAAEQQRRFREDRLDEFAAIEAIQERNAELLQLKEERDELRRARGLSRAERRARNELLGQRLELAFERRKLARDGFREFLESDRTMVGLDDLEPGQAVQEQFEIFAHAFGC